MHLARKSVAGILLVGLSLFIGGQAFAMVLTAPPQASASCHEHGHPASAPAPVNTRCCAAGHHAAVLQPVLELGARFVVVSQLRETALLTSTGVVPASLPQQVSSPSPPDVSVLRI